MKILKLTSTRKLKTIKKKIPTLKSYRWKKKTFYKPRKKYVSFRQRLVLAKKNPNKKRYYLFFKKTRNNVFLTITDVTGKVVISQSAGTCKITTKKKKKISGYFKKCFIICCKSSSCKEHKIFI
jgi:hypothetical protein